MGSSNKVPALSVAVVAGVEVVHAGEDDVRHDRDIGLDPGEEAEAVHVAAAAVHNVVLHSDTHMGPVVVDAADEDAVAAAAGDDLKIQHYDH